MEIAENSPIAQLPVLTAVAKLPRRFASSWLILPGLFGPQIAAQVTFGPKHHGSQCRKARVQHASDLGVTHSFVIEQHERSFVSFRQTSQLLSDLTVFVLPQKLGKWRWNRMIGDTFKVDLF
jgi:hypothetical protein